MLTTLTDLRSLHVRLQDQNCPSNLLEMFHLVMDAGSPLGDLRGLVNLTTLRSLQIEMDPRARHLFGSLAPLSALSGLTLLDLNKGWDCGLELHVTAEISVVSHLTALRISLQLAIVWQVAVGNCFV